MHTLTSLITRAKRKDKQIIAVANGADKDILMAVKLALELDLCNFILFGDIHDIYRLADTLDLDLTGYDVVVKHETERIAEAAIEAIHLGEATILMKGNISTKSLLRAVLAKDSGLRKQHLLSHIAIFEIPGRERFVFLTDAAINIAPTLEEKIGIVKNAVQMAKALEIKFPKIAIIAPVDVIDEAIPSTFDAAKLTEMQKNGEIKDCLIDGPISFDNAISPQSAQVKGINSNISGIADILMVPTIEVGNALYKSFIFFAHAKVAAVVCGAKVPIALASRADSPESKLYSLALAIIKT